MHPGRRRTVLGQFELHYSEECDEGVGGQVGGLSCILVFCSAFDLWNTLNNLSLVMTFEGGNRREKKLPLSKQVPHLLCVPMTAECFLL